MGSDVLAVGAIPSPRLCKLGLPHLPVGGVARKHRQNHQSISDGPGEVIMGLRRYGGVCWDCTVCRSR